MTHPLFDKVTIDSEPAAYLNTIGSAFAKFGTETQGSGNVSYGVEVDGERFFVKTAGDPRDSRPFLSHGERVSHLRNAVRLARSCSHPALPELLHVIESPAGPILIYEWIDGELLGVPRERRDDPNSPFQRFRRLPVLQIQECLDTVFELHRDLASLGWIAVDFYDGSMLYNFSSGKLYIVDLDMYRTGPFINEMGRMFGSSRFMAPEEFHRGSIIDERTTVYVMGRTAAVFLADGTLVRERFRGTRALFAVIARACQPDRRKRFPSVARFYDAWMEARTAQNMKGKE